MKNRQAKKIAKRGVFIKLTSCMSRLSCGRGEWDINRKIHKHVIKMGA